MKIQYLAILLKVLFFTIYKMVDAPSHDPTANCKTYTARNTDLSDISGFIKTELLQLNASVVVHSSIDTTLSIAKGVIGINLAALIHSP